MSESLARSALVRGAALIPPLRECAILVALVNHPPLIEEFYDQVETLEFSHPDLTALHRALFEALAEHHASDAVTIRKVIGQLGLTAALERATEQIRRTGQWPMLEAAALEDAREAFAQALHLHRVAGALHRELANAERMLAEYPSDENYLQLLDIQRQIRDAQATEAIIEGFGVSSGRNARS